MAANSTLSRTLFSIQLISSQIEKNIRDRILDRKLRQIQNGGHHRQISCNKTLLNDDVLQLLCPNARLFYRVVLSI